MQVPWDIVCQFDDPIYVGKLGNPFSSRYLTGMRLCDVRELGEPRCLG